MKYSGRAATNPMLPRQDVTVNQCIPINQKYVPSIHIPHVTANVAVKTSNGIDIKAASHQHFRADTMKEIVAKDDTPNSMSTALLGQS
jgi:hypothetical protein